MFRYVTIVGCRISFAGC